MRSRSPGATRPSRKRRITAAGLTLPAGPTRSRIDHAGEPRSPVLVNSCLDEDEEWTITFTPEACTVEPGNTAAADCFVKGTKAMFLDVWNGRYVPTLTDFLMGKIRSNNPMMLKEFYAAFVKK